jgi:hypothetical protein
VWKTVEVLDVDPVQLQHLEKLLGDSSSLKYLICEGMAFCTSFYNLFACIVY